MDDGVGGWVGGWVDRAQSHAHASLHLSLIPSIHPHNKKNRACKIGPTARRWWSLPWAGPPNAGRKAVGKWYVGLPPTHPPTHPTPPNPPTYPPIPTTQTVQHGLTQGAPVWREKVGEWIDVPYPPP